LTWSIASTPAVTRQSGHQFAAEIDQYEFVSFGAARAMAAATSAWASASTLYGAVGAEVSAASTFGAAGTAKYLSREQGDTCGKQCRAQQIEQLRT